MRFIYLLMFFLTGYFPVFSQGHQFFYDEFKNYREASINDRFFKHADIESLIKDLGDHPDFEVTLRGHSVEGRSIHLVRWGNGPKTIFMWTQMHGNEPTATMAVMDIFNFLSSEDHRNLKDNWADKVTLLFLPMVNPDGAEVYKRRNTLDVDLNRDALRLSSPESEILKSVREEYEADFGFNLHDQSLYYGAGHTGEPVAIAFLAPAYNDAKDVDPTRLKAMQLIAQLNTIVQNYVPGKVAKFNDTFEPRAFGDNMQKWGTSTVLIESGGLLDDPEKQYLRKLHFVMLLSAIQSIANQDFIHYSRDIYEAIPMNRISIFDLLVKNASVEFNGNFYTLDLGYRKSAVFSADRQSQQTTGASLSDVGDLSTSGGYRVFDATNYQLKHGEIYPNAFETLDELKSSNWKGWLREGYSYFIIEERVSNQAKSELPFLILESDKQKPSFPALGKDAALLGSRNGIVEFSIANGMIHELDGK